jgi:outer membrane protein assembly factor BamB/endonuclease YncB( thermonuclease family)
MSAHWFDALTRLLAQRASRRALTHAASVAVIGAAAQIKIPARVEAQSADCVECRAVSCRDATGSDDCHDQPCYAPMNEASSIYIPVTLQSPLTICPCEMCSARDSTTCYYWSGSHYRHDACVTYPGEIGRASSQATNDAATGAAEDERVDGDAMDTGTVVAVLDGDSVRAEIASTDQRLNITLLGIDAPEMGSSEDEEPECFGVEATTELRRLVEGKTVSFEGATDRDTASRAWRYLWIEGEDGLELVNETLVAGGFARAKSSSLDKRYDDRLVAAQADAQAANRGLWGACSTSSEADESTVGDAELAGTAMGAGDASRRSVSPGPDPASPPTLLWQFPAQMIRGGDPPPIAMAIAVGTTVIFSTQTENAPGLFALSLTSGSVIWTAPLGRISETPAVSGGLVYANTSSYGAASVDPFLYALSIEDGTEQWRFDTGGRILQGPSVLDGVVYVSSLPALNDDAGVSRVVALDANTGAMVWAYEDPDQGALSGTAVSDELIIVAKQFPASAQSILGLDRATGAVAWESALINSEFEWPVAADGRVLIRSYVELDKTLVALDLATGSEIWSTVLPGQPFSTPAAASGLILLACRGGAVLALDGETGSVVWQISNQQVSSAPTVTAEHAYFATWSGVLALDIATGETVWQQDLAFSIAEQRPFVIGGMILTVLTDGSLAVCG